jgi:AhpD family alkylhydroperoxidase
MSELQRLDYQRVAPEAVQALRGMSAYLQECAIDEKLRYLIELRVSQINGCVYCVDLHSRQARSAGESQQRLDCLTAWREAPFYSPKERAALEWAEAVTLVSKDHVPDSVYALAAENLTEKELADLTMVVVTMNAWNRLAIGFRQLPPLRKG